MDKKRIGKGIGMRSVTVGDYKNDSDIRQTEKVI